jgi:predicted PurR-regulated permease PerM
VETPDRSESPLVSNPGALPPEAPETPDRAARQGIQAFRRQALILGFGLITLTVLGFLLAIYLQFAAPIVWGLALAILFYPLHRVVLRLVRGRRNVAAGISTIISLAIIFLPAVLLVFRLIGEVQVFWGRIESSLRPDVYEQMAQTLDASPFRRAAEWAFGTNDLSAVVLQRRIEQGALDLQAFLLRQLRDITKSVPAALLHLAITVVVFFFFLKNGAEWVTQVKRGVPLVPEHTERLFSIAERTVNAVFRGVLLTAVLQAMLAGLGYWVAGAATPLLLASLTFIAALIPFLGPVAVWLPTVVVLFIAGKVAAAIGLAIWGTLVVSLIDNVLKPYFIGREVRLSLLWVFLAMVGGLKLFGFLGIVIGPITLALATACFRIYMEGRRAPAA